MGSSSSMADRNGEGNGAHIRICRVEHLKRTNSNLGRKNPRYRRARGTFGENAG